ncbi:MerR family transcriptional regulator [Alkaliphilus hydrothermalis]|uniref:DNA-binding transcriptional MerR regulator n=1 Tax=Alkaliphilus hydrothermalis TaxID=1482730 RepID=A0ABS2NMK6_9FIRM|nr:MerR family transcriptional regulator [Alkaliphilus hydrothermalis]MBM7614163.1 DNA-binding transcriptional MerR regulator [Alkaliphilus hydrothermalis]
MERKKLFKNEVIQLFNTTSETLRHYEEKGLLAPEVGENNYRYYGFEDLQKLRQIFMFRDLDISIKEMKALDEGRLNKKNYIEVLKNHRLALKQKIERLINIEADLLQLIDILEKGENRPSYLLRSEKSRQFYLLSPFESDVMSSPKAYYDHHQSIIKRNNYSERTIQITYDYENLQSGEFINAQLCIEITDEEDKLELEKDNGELLSLPKGYYLSIFYPFRHGKFDELKKMHEEIELYLKDNNLSRIGNVVIEKEHPELSLFLAKDTSVFELKIRVKKNNCVLEEIK